MLVTQSLSVAAGVILELKALIDSASMLV